ncbi:hypothetical protein M9Y10_042205 [Tritrichomonas musculus]|uniref:Initiator binding domain-containing protein n=1 Tax=Tritrichomonas musculus TaxID=1915356 RepID=A0ABR2K730_9EUKA
MASHLMTEKTDEQPQLPGFYDLLSDSDREGYNQLRSALSSKNCRNRRNKRLETFSEMLNAIHKYAIRNDENDWKRCLVCGVLWLSNGIAINTRQMRLLIDKCKSSINGSLHRMGYSAVTCRGDTSNQIVEQIPMLKNNFPELRQWTVRQMNTWTPQPTLAHVDPIAPIKANISVSPQPQTNSFFHLTPSTSCPTGLVDSAVDLMTPDYDNNNTFFFDDDFSLPLQSWVSSPPPTSPQQPASPQEAHDILDSFGNDFTSF